MSSAGDRWADSREDKPVAPCTLHGGCRDCDCKFPSLIALRGHLAYRSYSTQLFTILMRSSAGRSSRRSHMATALLSAW